MRRALLVFGGLALVLGAVTASIVQKERLLATGRVVLLELAPVDPRSLIQGDYMRLDYAVAREAGVDETWPRTGRIVVALDERGVGRYRRRHDGSPLAPGEQLLVYRMRAGRVRLGHDAFFFQEGHAARYEGAKYGEVRVDASGGSVLVGLRDEALQALR